MPGTALWRLVSRWLLCTAIMVLASAVAVAARPAGTEVPVFRTASGLAIGLLVSGVVGFRFAVSAVVAAGLVAAIPSYSPGASAAWQAVLSGVAVAVTGLVFRRLVRWRPVRRAAGREPGLGRRLAEPRDLAALIAAGLAGAVVLAICSLVVVRSGDGGVAWTTFGLTAASFVATVVVGSTTVLLVVSRRGSLRDEWRPELGVQLAATAASVALVFWSQQDLPLSYLPLPFLVWAALRFRPVVVAVELVAVAIVVSFLTLRGSGPIAVNAGADSALAVGLTQLWIICIGSTVLFVAVLVEQRRTTMVSLGTQQRLLERVFDSSSLGIVILDVVAEPTRLVRANRAATQLLGGADLPSWGSRIPAPQRRALRAAIADLVAGETTECRLDVTYAGPDQTRVLEVYLAPVVLEHAEVEQIVCQVEDVTVRTAEAMRLRTLADHDYLTGAVTRARLLAELGAALATCRADGRQLGLAFADLDDFKAVNDAAGHAAGDAVLVAVGQRLAATVRPEDVVARLGGDEFVVLCPGVQDGDSMLAVGRRLLAAVSAPVAYGEAAFEPSVSIGVIVSGGDVSPQDLLALADRAMYRAKRDGKAQVHLLPTTDNVGAGRTPS
ncbi:MAG: diguanylate cyclase [Actinomycetota bacterium]|nr:MAG: diguanylate cyclase [Actinomycetota bacterium]